MSPAPKILAFAGSVRKDSFNRKLIRLAAEEVKAAGGDVTLLELKDFPLPLFDQDLEAENGAPENAKKLKQIFLEHQGLLISAPEYNSSITPLLKNTIDWVSRPTPGEASLVAFQGKVASLISASPGALGGQRGLVTLRSLLGNIGVIVLPAQISVSGAQDAFDVNGALKNPQQVATVTKIAKALVETTRRFAS